MKLGTLASIATIIAATVAVIQYCSISEREITQKIPDSIKIKKEAISLNLDNEVYKGERNWLITMYNAAKSMPFPTEKSSALTKVVKTAISINDFNMAVIAATDIPFPTEKTSALMDIVKQAVVDKDSIGYAMFAADKIPFPTEKTNAIKIIIDASEREALMPKNYPGEGGQKNINKSNNSNIISK